MASALDQVESAVALLREAGMRGLALHWTGSVPFAFAVLIFWRTVTGYRVSDTTCVAAAFGMTAMLLWMSCWRAMFALELRRRLHGEKEARPAVANVFRNQAAAAGWKMVLLPPALLSTLPLAWMVAFFRGWAMYSDLGPAEAMARARKVARFDAKGNWAGLAILAMVWVFVFVNVVIAMVIVPQLLKALTGYESTFARSGATLMFNRLFFLSAILIVWLAIDPLVQAFYCVHCFLGESQESGADLRARLRALRRAVVCVAMLSVFMVPSVAAVTPTELDKSIERTLRSKEYDWRLPPEQARAGKSWLVTATDKFVAEVRRMMRAVVRLIEQVIRWLLRRPMGSTPDDSPAPAGALADSVRILIVVAMVAGVAILAGLRFRRRNAALPIPATRAAIDLADESLTADRLPEDEWQRLGEECLGRGEFRAALRAFYLGNLAFLNSRRLIALHPGKTNREYEREIRRRGRAVADGPPLLAHNIDEFERCWYGRHTADAGVVGSFRERLGRMKELYSQ